MTWLQGKFLALDLETTARNPLDALIVTASVIRIDAATGEKHVTEWLSDVGGAPIPPETTAIHGVMTEYARTNGQPSYRVVDQVTQEVRNAWAERIPIVGHNVGYDLTVLECENLRHWPQGEGLGPLGPVLCTYVIDGHVSYRKGKRNLVATAQHYGVPLSEQDAHGSTADALAAARILWMIAKRYPTIAGRTLAELFDDQISWHRERAESYAAHCKRVGKPVDDICPDWPIRTETVVGVPS